MMSSCFADKVGTILGTTRRDEEWLLNDILRLRENERKVKG